MLGMTLKETVEVVTVIAGIITIAGALITRIWHVSKAVIGIFVDMNLKLDVLSRLEIISREHQEGLVDHDRRIQAVEDGQRNCPRHIDNLKLERAIQRSHRLVHQQEAHAGATE